MSFRKYLSFEVFVLAGLLILEFVLFFSFISLDQVVLAQNTSENMLTFLTVGNVYPEVVNVSIQGGAGNVDLVANSTIFLQCLAVVQDFNGEGDIRNVSAKFFDNVASSYGGAADNNFHYDNVTCGFNVSYGDQFQAQANCTFQVQYYANNATWNCTVNVTDNASLDAYSSNITTINKLLALDVPNSINYGLVNATKVSGENVTRVINYGNIIFNLTVYGFAINGSGGGDNLSMNCTQGTIKNISINYEKYNLTSSNPGSNINITQFEQNYTNLTSNFNTLRKLNLNQRQNDTLATVDAFNDTYWRMYVPTGVAGSCSGHVEFVAAEGTGT